MDWPYARKRMPKALELDFEEPFRSYALTERPWWSEPQERMSPEAVVTSALMCSIPFFSSETYGTCMKMDLVGCHD